MLLPVAHESVIIQAMDDGAVLFAPQSELYYGLNTVGLRIWQLLPPQTQTLDALVETLGREYPDVPADQLAADVRELLDVLVSEGLAAWPQPAALDAPVP